jgi:hypothetical protein
VTGKRDLLAQINKEQRARSQAYAITMCLSKNIAIFLLVSCESSKHALAKDLEPRAFAHLG